ncbi:exonuclease [Actinoplanes sp. NPDC049596]|uniref:exonuclease n=1 Tax=unclassified Actinoplanes TaxID=2626549 RepID=UPI00341938B5
MSDLIYVVTDIEADGPWPGANSMLSFASVAVDGNGNEVGEFETVLEPLPGAAANPDTYAWFQTFPEAWAAATEDPRPVAAEMTRFADWVKGLPGPCVFTANPLAFDGGWIDYYLRRFTRYGVVQGPYEKDMLFEVRSGLCLRSYTAAVTGRPVTEVAPRDLPAEWFGHVEHTHRAIDDARGYAHLLRTLFTMAER